MIRNLRLVALATLLAGLVSACTRNAANPPVANDIAVYSEMSPTGMKKMAAGWNTRVFNTTEVAPAVNSSISTDMKTGYITLKRGTYHITASSLVTYNDLKVDPNAPGWNTHERPNGGYVRLRDVSLTPDPKSNQVENEKAIVIGTISNANMVPSLIDTYLTVTTESLTVMLEHQVGDVVDTIYLQDDSAGPFQSRWHVFARIAIRKIA
jgi:hypothetical protein